MKIISLILLLVLSHAAYALPIAKITVKVIDVNGLPVEGAQVGLGFERPKAAGQGAGIRLQGVKGLTDSDGLFTGSGETAAHVGIGVLKKGYYPSSAAYETFTGVSGIWGFRKYQPWNPQVEIVLKKKINPIPMYAIHMFGQKPQDYPLFPALNRFFAYDLSAHDWVAPHGSGKHRDFLFEVTVRRAVSPDDYDVSLTLAFSNPQDGIIPYRPDISRGKSALRLPYKAPLDGYQSRLVKQYSSQTTQRDYLEKRGDEYSTNYLFRVRTKTDQTGAIRSALYGKIHGEIRLANFNRLHETSPFVIFDYYLNPNQNDRNIEFNTRHNLFHDLNEYQQVTAP